MTRLSNLKFCLNFVIFKYKLVKIKNTNSMTDPFLRIQHDFLV